MESQQTKPSPSVRGQGCATEGTGDTPQHEAQPRDHGSAGPPRGTSGGCSHRTSGPGLCPRPGAGPPGHPAPRPPRPRTAGLAPTGSTGPGASGTLSTCPQTTGVARGRRDRKRQVILRRGRMGVQPEGPEVGVGTEHRPECPRSHVTEEAAAGTGPTHGWQLGMVPPLPGSSAPVTRPDQE